MDDRLRHLEAKVDALAEALERIEARLQTLEGAPTATGAARAQPPPAAKGRAPPAAQAPAAFPTVAGVLSLAGRTCLVFGGAWLLRAVTDAGALPQGGGVALGLVYSLAWIVFAYRAAGTGHRLSAEFHGVTATVIAYPLLWEGTTKFAVLPAPVAAAILFVTSGVGLAVAWQRNLRALAWATTLVTLTTAVALLVATQAMELFSALLVLLGVATVWLCYERHWLGVAWAAAAVLDLVVLEMVSLVTRPEGPPEAYQDLSASTVELVAVALLVAYLGSFAVRTLVHGRDVGVFEAVQTIAALLVGLGGAVRTARAAGAETTSLGMAALAAAIACYAAAFALVDRRAGRGRNFVFYTSLALVLTVSGSLLVAAGWPLVLLWCALALITAVLGGTLDRVTLRAHSAAYLAAAAAEAGLLVAAASAFLAPVDPPWGQLEEKGWLVLGAAIVCYVALAATCRREGVRWPARIPHLAAGVVSVIGTGGVAVLVLLRLLASPSSYGDAAVLAALRTVVLASATLLLAALGRWSGFRELAWLVYPVLIAGGIKLLLQDLFRGRPATLVLAFAAYGVALIVAPRLLRRRQPATD